MSLSLDSLDAVQSAQMFDVTQSYVRFWNTVKKTRWQHASLLSNSDHVEEYLSLAAEIVTRVRSRLDCEKPANPHRLKEGSAVEFLWLLDYYPEDHPRKFTRGLVHATFSDSKGYLEGLSKSQLDHWIDQVFDWKDREEAERMASIAHDEEAVLEESSALYEAVCHLFGGTERDAEWKKSIQYSKSVNAVKKALHKASLTCKAYEHKVEKLRRASEESKKRKRGESHADEMATESMKPTGQAEDEGEASATMMDDGVIEDKSSVNESALLEIQRVGGEVAHLEDVVHHLTEGTDHLDIEDLKKNPEKSERMLEKYQYECLASIESLMKDLYRLDAITGVPDIRPARKKQVGKIQHLLSDVDAVKEKLHDYMLEIRADREQEEETKQDHIDSPKDDDAIMNDEDDDAKEKSEDVMVPSPDQWASLRLEPHLVVTQSPHAFVITGHIPGMRQDDVEIKVSDDGTRILTICGKRIPTDADVHRMQAILANVKQRDPLGLYRSALSASCGDPVSALLHVGQGRFGSFEEKFRLPAAGSVDMENLKATYDDAGGQLSVVIPRTIIRSGSPYHRGMMGLDRGF